MSKPDLRNNLDLRKIVATTDFLVHKLFDLRKFFPKSGKNRDFFDNFRAILKVFSYFFSIFGLKIHKSNYIS